jgi:hypothetical protein
MQNLKKLLFRKASTQRIETIEKGTIFLNAKKGENFNHPSTICKTYGAGRHTFKYFED